MRKAVVLILCAAAMMLAACGSTPTQSASASTPAAEATAVPTPGPTAQPEVASAQAGTVEEQRAVLDTFVAYEADTAGGSLKNTQAGAGLVEFLSYADLEVGTMQDWLAGLDEQQRAALDTNWPGILANAQAICEDPAAQADQLDTAGVTTNFEDMALTEVPDKLVTVNTILTGKA